jgi:hypothetical protein
MQAPTAPPRDALTAAQVTALIQDAPAVVVGAGLELLDMTLAVLEDISDDFAGGAVSRASYATLHGTATLGIARDLDWGRAIVRPYMTMTDGTTTARFNLGAYFTSTPARDVETIPQVHDVQGYDILHGLNSPVGEAYAVDAGVGYLAAVEQILTDQGYTAYLIDQSATASVLPSARVWPLDEATRWLSIINDLLASVGYAGAWSDWDGRLRCAPYVSPLERTPEWYYDAGPETSMLSARRSYERDFFEAPNRWVAVRSNNIDDVAPVEGDGIFTFVNDHEGDTSVDARGRVITRVMMLDAADQAALEAQAQITIDSDRRLPIAVKLSTFPNPLHWHFDRLVVNDPESEPFVDVLSTQWTLPLDGADMSHEWTVL